jgi:L-rhamnose mutarotase
MERIAFHLTIRDGKREEYREAHRNIPEEFERLYLDSGAGIETYSVFEKDGHVFGYMEVEHPEIIKEVMENQDDWDDDGDGGGGDREPLVEETPGEEFHRWMDEVYRMR